MACGRLVLYEAIDIWRVKQVLVYKRESIDMCGIREKNRIYYGNRLKMQKALLYENAGKRDKLYKALPQ